MEGGEIGWKGQMVRGRDRTERAGQHSGIQLLLHEPNFTKLCDKYDVKCLIKDLRRCKTKNNNNNNIRAYGRS